NASRHPLDLLSFPTRRSSDLDDEGHEEEEQDVDALDGRLQELELLVVAKGLRDPAHLRLQTLADVRAHHDHRGDAAARLVGAPQDRKSTRLNSSHSQISYAVF